jgi:hypothetical protein
MNTFGSWLQRHLIFSIEADTTVLVGALFILGDRVKCIPIYLVDTCDNQTFVTLFK